MRDLPQYLTQDELRRFFAAIDSPRDRALFAGTEQSRTLLAQGFPAKKLRQMPAEVMASFR